MTRAEFEAALDASRLQIREDWPDGPHWYNVRRAGKTTIWKRTPGRFRIPLKYKFHTYSSVNQDNFTAGTIDRWFRVGPKVPGGDHV